MSNVRTKSRIAEIATPLHPQPHKVKKYVHEEIPRMLRECAVCATRRSHTTSRKTAN